MNSKVYLDEIQIGDVVRVKKLSLEENIKRRLLDIGLIQGGYVQCVFESPFHDPKAYLIRGSIMAIRKEDAKGIEVEYV